MTKKISAGRFPETRLLLLASDQKLILGSNFLRFLHKLLSCSLKQHHKLKNSCKSSSFLRTISNLEHYMQPIEEVMPLRLFSQRLQVGTYVPIMRGGYLRFQ